MEKFKPKFMVEFLEKNKKHYYRIRGENKLYQSVTCFLDMIGGNKSKALQIWRMNQAIEYISEKLEELKGKNIEINDEFIEQIKIQGKKQPDWTLEKAANIGSKAHMAFDDFIITGKVPEMDEQTKHLFNNFKIWLDEHQMKFIMPDTAVIYKGEDGFEFGGKFDAIVQDKNGKLILIDFKSSNHIVEDYALQLSFYYLAFKYTYGVEIDEGMIVRLDKEKPIFEIQKITKEKLIKNIPICKALVTLKNGFDGGVWE